MPTLQVVVGTYEKVLHGLTATLPDKFNSQDTRNDSVSFADTFLFQAHGSAIRSLAVSPTSFSDSPSKPKKIILASGGSDERINLYHLSASSPRAQGGAAVPTSSLGGNGRTENPSNWELGSLLHHSSSVNALYFPTRSKLLSAADDNTIAVTRTRDWTVLSSIKAPIPKAHGRPSGDTAPLGGTPAGVNDFAVHPSTKLMVSVGKGEKCMRLWNLVTGKKAGVLNFEKEMLHGVGEGRWGSGEGRKVRWNGLGEQFVVAFERGAVLFGLDSKPKARILPSPTTKIHQIRYVEAMSEQGKGTELLAVSTEDGRIMFYRTAWEAGTEKRDQSDEDSIPTLSAVGQLGGANEGQTNRIKDFEILSIPDPHDSNTRFAVVSGSSDGKIRIWVLYHSFCQGDFGTNGVPDINGTESLKSKGTKTKKQASAQDPASLSSIGLLLGTYETGNRITCLKAFFMFDATSNDTRD